MAASRHPSRLPSKARREQPFQRSTVSSTTTSTSSLRQSTVEVLTSQPSQPLQYSIAAVSSYSSSYTPANILIDRPQDLASRWSGASVAAVVPANTTTSNIAAAHAAIGSPSGPSANGAPPPPTPSAGGSGGVSITATGKMATPTPLGPISGKQYVVLGLDDMAIVKSIYFGKFHKAHPCNLKDFKIYGGPSPDPNSGLWTRLLRAGLRNDAVPEEFPLRWTDGQGVPMPLRYIKLVPLAAHSPNYNFSVWHIALKGVADKTLVAQAAQEYDEHCEGTTMRLILKHLRARGHHEAFQALLSSSKLDGRPTLSASIAGSSTARRPRPSTRPFEHPLVTQLYQAIMRGDWDAAEACLDASAGLSGMLTEEMMSSNSSPSLFASFVSKCAQQAEWKRLLGTDANGDIPSARGGHQLVLDTVKGTAYLFGGWDGKTDLNDLWIYYIEENRWRCISRDTTLQGGPSPRSCHRMAFDSRSGIIYVLGRYIDFERPSVQGRSGEPDDTASRNNATAEGGATLTPSAMARSPHAAGTPVRTTRELPPSLGLPHRTGANASESSSNRASTLSPNPATGSSSRDQGNRTTSSPRGHEVPIALYASDFFRFSTRNERWDRLSSDTALDGGPRLIFDHQMVVDEESQIMYVFGGRVVHWDPAQLQLSGMWSYDCIQRTWTFLFDDDTRTGGKIPSRAGHSMLLDAGVKSGPDGSNKRQLWILAGQRADTYLADMYTYSLSTGQVRQISRDYSQGGGGPEGGFTQRATIDPVRRVIHLYNGIVRHTKQTAGGAKSALWVYNIDRDEWRQVWTGGTDPSAAMEDDEEEEEEEEEQEEISKVDIDEVGSNTHGPRLTKADLAITSPIIGPGGSSLASSKQPKHREPQPRYASQLVFDPKSDGFLLFGGNPAMVNSSQGRLDDLWSLRLLRPKVQEVLRRAKFQLRQQKFKEMAAAVPRPGMGLGLGFLGGGGLGGGSALSPSSAGIGGGLIDGSGGMKALEALDYLQTEVSAVVDHDNLDEARTFRRLVSGLLGGVDPSSGEGEEGEQVYPVEGGIPSIGHLQAEVDDEDHDDVVGTVPVPVSVPYLADGLQGDQERQGEEEERDEGEEKGSNESDGLPAVDDDDADMLSISQVLPRTSSPPAPAPAPHLSLATTANTSTPTSLPSTVGFKNNRTSSSSSNVPQAQAQAKNVPSSLNNISLHTLQTTTSTSTSTSTGTGTGTDYSHGPPLEPSQRPPALFTQRLTLFKTLLGFFPPEQVQPPDELALAVRSFVLAPAPGNGSGNGNAHGSGSGSGSGSFTGGGVGSGTNPNGNRDRIGGIDRLGWIGNVGVGESGNVVERGGISSG